MKVICTQETIQSLELKEATGHFNNDYRGRLTIGKAYIVMGLTIYKRSNCPYYLIDHEGWPIWTPYMFFNVADNKIPHNWYVKLFNKNGEGTVSILMGFNDLCNDDDFHDALADREEQAMLTYFERAKEMEQELYRKASSL